MAPRSKLIEKSLSCLHAGLFSLIPVIGLFGTVPAFFHFRFVVIETNDRWNPARRRLYLGLILALVSLVAHGLAALAISIILIRRISNG